jgi:alpha-1,3-rhamnosyl/mannosyltransferase
MSLLTSQAQVVLFPSLYEGFGLPVLDAFAASVPVVTSDTSSLPEVAGPAAVLVNPLSE